MSWLALGTAALWLALTALSGRAMLEQQPPPTEVNSLGVRFVRVPADTRYPNGNDPQRLGEIANNFDASAAVHWPQWRAFAQQSSDGFAFTSPVGRFEPNAWGLHDMLGNAWEWVSDWHDDYYARSPIIDPQGPATGDVRVRRGGSWHSWALDARCGYRNWNAPSTRYTLVGMRLLLEAK